MQQHRARSEPRNAKWKALKNAHQQSSSQQSMWD